MAAIKHCSQFKKNGGDGEDGHNACVETEGSSGQAVEQGGGASIATVMRPRSTKMCDAGAEKKMCDANGNRYVRTLRLYGTLQACRVAWSGRLGAYPAPLASVNTYILALNI